MVWKMRKNCLKKNVIDIVITTKVYKNGNNNILTLKKEVNRINSIYGNRSRPIVMENNIIKDQQLYQIGKVTMMHGIKGKETMQH